MPFALSACLPESRHTAGPASDGCRRCNPEALQPMLHAVRSKRCAVRYARMAWENHFLDTLQPADIAMVRPLLTPVVLARNDVLDEVMRPIRQVYFPVDSILSVVTVMRDGSQVESRTIGRESANLRVSHDY